MKEETVTEKEFETLAETIKTIIEYETPETAARIIAHDIYMFRTLARNSIKDQIRKILEDLE